MYKFIARMARGSRQRGGEAPRAQLLRPKPKTTQYKNVPAAAGPRPIKKAFSLTHWFRHTTSPLSSTSRLPSLSMNAR